MMMRFLKQSVVGENTGKSLLSLDVDNTDNRLNMTEKWRCAVSIALPQGI